MIQNKTRQQAEEQKQKQNNIMKQKGKQSKNKKQEPETDIRYWDSLFNKPKNTGIAWKTVIFIRNRKKQAQRKKKLTHKKTKIKKIKTTPS